MLALRTVPLHADTAFHAGVFIKQAAREKSRLICYSLLEQFPNINIEVSTGVLA